MIFLTVSSLASKVLFDDILDCHRCVHSYSLSYEAILITAKASIGMHMMHNSVINLSSTLRATLTLWPWSWTFTV